MSGRDLYEILQVSPNADAEIIAAAYRRLALRYHPDLNPGSVEATRQMAGINSAYEVLSDLGRRSDYDRARAAARAGKTVAAVPPSPQPSPQRPPRPSSRPEPRQAPIRPAVPPGPRLRDFGLTQPLVDRVDFIKDTLPMRLGIPTTVAAVAAFLFWDLTTQTSMPMMIGMAVLAILVGCSAGIASVLILYMLVIYGVTRLVPSYRNHERNYERYQRAFTAYNSRWSRPLLNYWKALDGPEFAAALTKLVESTGLKLTSREDDTANSGSLFFMNGVDRIVVTYRTFEYPFRLEDAVLLRDLLSSNKVSKIIMISHTDNTLQIPQDLKKFIQSKPIILFSVGDILHIERLILSESPDEARRYILKRSTPSVGRFK